MAARKAAVEEADASRLAPKSSTLKKGRASGADWGTPWAQAAAAMQANSAQADKLCLMGFSISLGVAAGRAELDGCGERRGGNGVGVGLELLGSGRPIANRPQVSNLPHNEVHIVVGSIVTCWILIANLVPTNN